jgi:hypothetical protein
MKEKDVKCYFCKNHSPLEEQFKAEVYDRATLVDRSAEYDWLSITVGWAIARGLPLSSEQDSSDFYGSVHDFALHIRYHTPLG